MLFWILVTLLAGVTASLLILTLLRHRDAGLARADYDIAVYRDQLAGVEADLARGVITDEAAQRLRTEIARRILEADRRRDAEAARTAPTMLNAAAVGLAGAVVVGGSLWLYDRIGAPGYGDLPLQARLAASEEMRRSRPSQQAAEAEAAAAGLSRPDVESDPRFEELLQTLRETMSERPEDPRGWELLAANEARMGNFAAAYAAQERLIELRGASATADDYATLGEMKVLAAGGYVSPEAEAALGQALARNPQSGPARYYIGLMQAQNGRPDQAFGTWRALLSTSAPDAPWVPAIRTQITDVAARAGINFTLPSEEDMALAPVLSAPTAEEMRAAEQMSAEERTAMIRAMVGGLSERLATEGGSPAEWARLFSSLAVLGEVSRAQAIYDEAQEVFASDTEALARLAGAAMQAGLAP